MDIQTLRKNLAIADGKVTITADTGGTDGYKTFFTSVFGTADITISDAKPGPGDSGDTVQVTGTASAFLSVDGAPITATFVLDASTGDVTAELQFTLPSGWKFSTSFPDLPVSFDFTSPTLADTTVQISPLDDLDLKSAAFIATSAATSVTLSVDGADKTEQIGAGLNFIGVMGLGKLLTVFEKLTGLPTEYALTGTIVEPSSDSAPALADSVNALPTAVHATPPGITLTADLGFEQTLGSKLKLDETTFSVYSPLTADWLKNNPTYEPYAAFHCALEVPSASLKLDLTSKLLKNIPQMVITGEFTGFTLSNLANLVDMAGTDGLFSTLPDSVQSLGSKIGELQLIDASISIQADGTSLSVQYVDMSIGMPQLNWSLADGAFEIDSLVTTFTVNDPFDSAKRAISIVMDGHFEIDTAPVEISASANIPAGGGQTEYFITGELEEAQTIQLQKFFAKYLPSVPVEDQPSDLTIDSLVVNIDLGTEKSFSLTTEMAKDPAWTLPLTANHLQIQDVQVGVSKTFGDEGSLSGNVSGSLIIDTDIIFDVSYDPTAGFSLRGNFPDISLAGLIGALGVSQSVLPAAFAEIDLTDSSLLITAKKSDYKLYFGTEVADLGSFVFDLVDEGGEWGFAIGIDLKPVKIAELPGLADVKPLTDVFSFVGDLVLIASTIDPSDIDFPALSEFQNPKITAKKVTVPAIGTGQSAGLYVFASTTLDNNETLENLASLLDISKETEIDAGVFIGENPATNSKVFLSISTIIDNSVHLNGALGLEMTTDGPAFYMIATASTEIQGEDVDFDVTLVVTALGLFIGGDMKVTTGDGTIDFWVFKLKALALEAGISFEDGLPSLGVFAELNIGEVDSSVAIYIDTANPAQSMVAASVSDLNLKMVVDELSGAKGTVDDGLGDALALIGLKGINTFPVSFATYADALNTYDLTKIAALFKEGGITLPSGSGQVQLVVNKKNALWYMVVLEAGGDGNGIAMHYELVADGDNINVSLEAQMYAVPEATTIASIPFAQGFFLAAEIDFLFIQDKIEVLVEPPSGIGIDIELSKIVIGSETFFSITNPEDSSKGPQLLLSTFSDPGNPIKVFQERQFKVAGKIDILGFGPTVEIDIEADKACFDIRDDMPFGFVEIQADISKTDGMTGSGSAGVGLNINVDLGKLGSIHINDDVTASLGLGVTPSDIFCNAAFGFEVGGVQHTIASFNLDVTTQALANLPAEFLKAIEDFFEGLFEHDVKKWLEYVKNGIVAGFEDLKKLGEVLIDVFKQTAKEAAIVLKAVGYAAEEVASLLEDAYDLAKEEAEKIVNFLWTTLEGCATETSLLASGSSS